MDNLTPEVLKALSEAATPEEWRDTSLWPWKQAGVVDADGLHVATFSNVLDRDLALALVNAYRAGLLAHVDAKGDGSALREALVKIANRPSQMIWGEDSEARAAMNDMEAIADAALKGGPMTDPITLALCPFCGGEASRPYKGHGGDKRKCRGCGATATVDAWNRRALPIARPVAGAEMVEKVARALCEGAIGGRCACSGEFSCADEYPGRQARAALAAMGYEVRE